MELQLSRVDYQQVGLTNPKCLRVLPTNMSRAQQKVAVGDSDGFLQLFSMKRGALQLGFKTVPGKSITRLQLGGALNTPKDKIFVASGNEVRGYTKKGKQFLGFDTNLAEEIKSMHVSGSDLLVCGDYVYSHFKDCQDANDFLCPDKIADVISLPAEKVRNMVPVVAGEDRLVRVLQESEVLYSVELPGTPSVLHLFYGDAGETGDLVLYGTTDGRVGLMQLGRF